MDIDLLHVTIFAQLPTSDLEQRYEAASWGAYVPIRLFGITIHPLCERHWGIHDLMATEMVDVGVSIAMPLHEALLRKVSVM